MNYQDSSIGFLAQLPEKVQASGLLAQALALPKEELAKELIGVSNYAAQLEEKIIQLQARGR